jgi:hypothetical protein
MLIWASVPDGALRCALQMVGNEADIGIAILSLAGEERLVLLGITGRLKFMDAPAHAITRWPRASFL